MSGTMRARRPWAPKAPSATPISADAQPSPKKRRSIGVLWALDYTSHVQRSPREAHDAAGGDQPDGIHPGREQQRRGGERQSGGDRIDDRRATELPRDGRPENPPPPPDAPPETRPAAAPAHAPPAPTPPGH